MKRTPFRFLVVMPIVWGCAAPPVSTNRDPLPIRAVRTWQDLIDQPAIPLDPGTARLGIEAQSAPCGSGVLLYALTEGYSLPRQWGTGRLGPFRIAIERDGVGEAPSLGLCERDEWPDTARAFVLFRKTIPLAYPGKIRIRVFPAEGGADPVPAIAETVVTVTREAFHPWMPFEPDFGGPEGALPLQESKPDDRSIDAWACVRNRSKGIAIPSFDGMASRVCGSSANPARTAAGDRLPTLLPDAAAGGLTVGADGTDLLVESRERIFVARPDWHFLARWWINGRPYVPEQLESFSDANGIVILGNRLLLRLVFDPRRMGVKPGDEVELQLLYCKNGWELVQPGPERLSAHRDDEGPEILLSNRARIAWEKGGHRPHDAPAAPDTPHR
jgi:hypothetical protein